MTTICRLRAAEVRDRGGGGRLVFSSEERGLGDVSVPCNGPLMVSFQAEDQVSVTLALFPFASSCCLDSRIFDGPAKVSKPEARSAEGAWCSADRVPILEQRCQRTRREVLSS